MTTQTQQPQPFAVSRLTASKLFDCSLDTIDRLVARGVLEKVQVGPRKVAVTMRSLQKLLPGASA
jgi:hypothetical protein